MSRPVLDWYYPILHQSGKSIMDSRNWFTYGICRGSWYDINIPLLALGICRGSWYDINIPLLALGTCMTESGMWNFSIQYSRNTCHSLA